MIKLETHCHSAGGSPCGTTSIDDIVKFYKDAGYGGIVLTNHYDTYLKDYYGVENDTQVVDRFFALYDELSVKCAKVGIKTFFGAEVRISCTFTEYMLYGFDRQFLYDNKNLCALTQRELFTLADKNGLFMFQTHPFRNGIEAGDPKYMHGAESFNGHYHHYNNNDKAEEFCEKNNLIKMSGTDFHHDDQPITAGMMIPDDIETNEQLTKYIKKNNFERIKDVKTYESALKAHVEGR